MVLRWYLALIFRIAKIKKNMSKNGKLMPYEKGITWSQKVRSILDTMSQEESTKISSFDQSNSNSQESEDEELIPSSQPPFVPPKPKRYLRNMAPPPSDTNFENSGIFPPNSKKSRVASTSLVQQTSASHKHF